MPRCPQVTRLVFAVVMAGAAGAVCAAGEDLPSPAAMALGQRLVPEDLVRGFRDGVATEALDGALAGRASAARAPAIRVRARAAMTPALDEAFPPELVAGVCAQFVASHYSGEEIRALSAWEGSPLGQKLRAFEVESRAVVAADPAAAERARVELARRTFTDAERKQLATFAASPLAARGKALAPELTAHLLEQLDRRLAAVRGTLRPKLASAVEAVLATEPGSTPNP